MPAARKLAADPDAGIWLGLISGDLARYAHGKLETFPFKQSISPDVSSYVKDLLVKSDGSIMGATAFGVIAWKAGKQQQFTVRNGLPCDYIHALQHRKRIATCRPATIAFALWLVTMMASGMRPEPLLTSLLPAWYQTGWFRTSAAIAAILFIGSFIGFE